jgi:single-strand DNA-binding protein
LPNLNRVTLIGHLGADPEVKPAGETTATKFNLAVADRWKDKNDEKQEHTNWVPITVWNGRGENLPQYIRKGSCVLVEGSLRVTSYGEGADRKFYTEVVASNVVFLDKKDAKKPKPRAVK